ncbi:PAS domain-containing protein [Agrobacterium vitis]|uniref:PAS domain-containing protein n=1 Tax=Agrobacterium vitis TaxID=373 RepID=UPI0008734573|nr:PAS domain-containing protein [Agrobacterium vitis]MCE6076812.1 PAS domain-containing protein [Agrobacterium vitis]MCM2450107.1 PAS domain-containing protein [Agrobacterium vitis]MCM2470854.1 PAS domain-containing protein [Agrobacterium vitis]MUO71196.1 PAS domain-containing protein [Agrobacterium vitis]MUO84340.1 PAS domain-containing protein [Agrobacterium vitis]
MRPTIDLSFESVLIGEQVPDAGFYAWDIPDNILYADSALAALFGLDAGMAERGLSIEDYLERVHLDDRPRLAKTIRDSIVGHHPQQEVYRVLDMSGTYVTVASYGRGFLDAAGSPNRYVGIVIPAAQDMQSITH